MTSVLFQGTPSFLLEALPQALQQAGITMTDALPASLLINLTTAPAQAIDAATTFAAAVPPGEEVLVINLLPTHAPDDWQGASAAATIWAFTRYAARAWAPRQIRVNALSFGACPNLPDQPRESTGQAASGTPAIAATQADVAATVLAFWRLRSMTGQMIKLGSAA